MENRRNIAASRDLRERLVAEATSDSATTRGPLRVHARPVANRPGPGEPRVWEVGTADRLRRLGARLGRTWASVARTLGTVGRRGWPPRHGLRAFEQAAEAGAKLFVIRSTQDGMLFDWVNPAFEAATGLGLVQLAGRPLDEVLPAALAVTLARRCRECLIAGAPQRYVSTLPLPAGQLRWSMVLTPGRSGKAAALIFGSAQDAFGVPQAPVKPASGDTRPKLAFTALPDGRLEHVDEGALDCLGLPPDAGLEQMLARIHPEDVVRLKPRVRRDDRDASVALNARFLGSDGAYHRFSVQADLFKGPAGRLWYGAAVGGEGAHPKRRAWSAGQYLFDVIRSLDGCCATIDRDGMIERVTPKAAAWLGMGEAQLIGISLRDDLPPAPALLDAVQAAFETGQPSRAVFPALMRPGRWTECRVFPFKDRANVVFWDVTETMGAAEQSAPELFREFAEALPAEMALLDAQGRMVASNAAWRAANGEKSAGLVGTPYGEICRQLIPGLDEAAFRREMDALLAGRSLALSLFYMSGGSGPPRSRELRITPLRFAGQRTFVAAHGDKIDSLVGRPQEIAEELLAVQEQERQRIAIELHDSTSQHLVALGLGVARLRRLVGGRRGTERVLSDMSISVEEAVKEIRVLSYLTMPPGLQKDGLQATARAFVKGFGTRTGLHATFDAEGEVDNVSSAVKHASLRLVQEALSNVYRHAEAQSVEVQIARRRNTLTLRIADDGKGIPSLRDGSQEMPNAGVGVAGMQARVAQLGGTLQITSACEGAVVTATLPAFAASASVRRAVNGPM